MRLLLLALVAAFGLAATPAAAQMVRGQDPQSLVTALKAAGYTAQLGADRVGDPMITSGFNGTTFQIFFYNCTNNRDCATITFHSGYDLRQSPTLQHINLWNRSKRFGRAYLDNENDPSATYKAAMRLRPIARAGPAQSIFGRLSILRGPVRRSGEFNEIAPERSLRCPV